MSCSVKDILKHSEFDPSIIQRISTRRTPILPLAIEAPDPAWPEHFETLRSLIADALGPTTALAVSHVGSTSVPGLPAKAVIDIDLTVPDPAAEADYVPALEAVGFQFLTREPEWHSHRFFAACEPLLQKLQQKVHCNLHVFAPHTAELERHLILREWLRAHADDRALYARTKVEAAEASNQFGETVMQYNMRKQGVIREILERAFRAKGYLPQVGGTNVSGLAERTRVVKRSN